MVFFYFLHGSHSAKAMLGTKILSACQIDFNTVIIVQNIKNIGRISKNL